MRNDEPPKNVAALGNPRDGYRITCLYGGSGSGKTYTALRHILWSAYDACQQRLPYRACICRHTYPELKLACFEQALGILIDDDIGEQVTVRRSPDLQISFDSRVVIDFRHADKPEKIKGAEYDVWLLDEVTDISRDFYRETLIRVPRGKDRHRYLDRARHILTWNPVSMGSWVYEEFFTKQQPDDVQIVKSTYKDNPYVDPELVKQLEEWKETDPYRWQVLGLGEWGNPDELIYSRVRTADDHDPKIPKVGRRYDAIGVDWGYANPTAVVGIIVSGDTIVANELLYKTGIPISELMTWMGKREELVGVPIYCDPSAPGSIEDVRRVGLWAEPADNNVNAGISWLQSHDIVLTPKSVNLKKEMTTYHWAKDVSTGKITDRPVKILDHAVDALRYAAYTWHTSGADQHVEIGGGLSI